VEEVILDPMGAIIGPTHPCASPPDPPQEEPEVIGSYGLAHKFGDSCYLDGVQSPCDYVMSFLNQGAAVPAPVQTTPYNYRTNQFEFFRATADGRSGFLPMGVTPNERGMWYHPAYCLWRAVARAIRCTVFSLPEAGYPNVNC
jgi:hypothetical protein